MADGVHPVDERLPIPILVPLAIQHVLVMYAGAVAVPLIIGRALNLAPEQVESGTIGYPGDVYALGLVLLEALTGVRAYRGPMLEQALARLWRQPEIPASLGPGAKAPARSSCWRPRTRTSSCST